MINYCDKFNQIQDFCFVCKCPSIHSNIYIKKNLFIVAKLKEEILINIEKIRAIFNKIENIPKNDLRSKLNKYEEVNILIDDLISQIWRMISGKNRVNNEIHINI